MLTLEQRIYLIQCYGIGEVSYKYAIEIFNRKFPDVYVSVNTLRNLVHKFTVHGDVKDVKKRKKIYDENDAATILVLESVRINPQLSLRTRAKQVGGISKSHVNNIMSENKFYAFKPTFIHKLQEGDDLFRLEFSLLMGERILESRIFHHNIIFTDESTFTTNGIISTQNCRFWAKENPHFKIYTNSQKVKKVNVWCALTYNRVIGPFFLERRLNSNYYLEILNEYFMPQLEEENLEFRRNMVFQQDGCPAHSTLVITNWLNEQFPQKWIGRHGPIYWPPRSPDLTGMDYFLWGYLKQKVYATDMHDNIEVLKDRITDAIATVTPEIIHNVYHEFRERMEKCVDVGGFQVE